MVQAARSSKREYTQKALEFWFQRLDSSWEDFFADDILTAARKLYVSGQIHELVLEGNQAFVYLKEDRELIYSVIDWDKDSPKLRNSFADDLNGNILAVAGMYEIEELVSEEVQALLPDLEEVTDTSADDKNRVTEADIHADEEGGRPLLLKLTAVRQGVRLEPFWIEESSRRKAWEEGDIDFRSKNRAERMRIMRFSSYVRSAGFFHRDGRKDYLLTEPSAIIVFLRKELERWERRFTLEFDEALSCYAEGIQDVDLQAKVSQDEAGWKLKWQGQAHDKLLSSSETAYLMRRADSVVFMPKVGMLRLSQAHRPIAADWEASISEEGEASMQHYMLLSLAENHALDIEFDEDATEWRDSLLASESMKEKLPSLLRDYQRRGVMWLDHLLQHKCHPLLADEMGLGKTLQALSLLGVYMQRYPGKSNLVVCPASVVPVWLGEVKRFFPQIRTAVLSANEDFSNKSDVDLWVASYTQLRRKKKLLEEHTFSLVILDEAQLIKNPDAKISQACTSIRSDYRMALSGTPIENKLLDLWSVFRFLMPGLLGSRKRLEIESRDEIFEAALRLRKQVEPFVLRRTKTEAASELPDKQEITLLCPLNELQQKEYQKLTTEGVEKIGDKLGSQNGTQTMSLFALLTRLRQLCCDPSLLPWIDRNVEYGPKLQMLGEKIDDIVAMGRKVVVFSQFVKQLDRAEELLKERLNTDVPIYRLTGSTKDRAKPVDSFQKKEGSAVILVSLKAGGVGVTLHAAEYVFLLDPWWNPAVENQAIDRVHRIGQENHVMVYRMVASNSIEERIQALKDSKTELFEGTLGGLRDVSQVREHFNSLSDLLMLRENNE